MPGLGKRPLWRSYAIALLLVAAAFAARWSIHDQVGSYYAYTAFYPVVVITAYLAGAGPAILAAALAAPLGFFGFSAPGLQLEGLGFFILTSSVTIALMEALSRALRRVDEERRRAEGLAAGNAELFRELNERVANHLQLVAGLLRVEARSHPDALVADALAEASSRTLGISRVHRGLHDAPGSTVAFEAFARLLLGGEDIACAADLSIESSEVSLPPEQATSVAVVLLECVGAAVRLPRHGERARITIALKEALGLVQLEVRCPADPAAAAAIAADDPFTGVAGQVVRAMTEQLDGRLSVTARPYGVVYSLSFPSADATQPRQAVTPTPMAFPASAALH